MPDIPELDSYKPKNFWCNVADGALFFGAMAMVPINILIPAFVKKYTDSPFIINLVPALFILGITAPQILSARHVEALAFRKRLMLITGVVQRLPWLLMAVAVFLFGDRAGPLPLVLFFAFFVVFAIATGINIPAWLDLFGKLVPVRLRGRCMAYRQLGGLAIGVGGAYLARLILKHIAFPHDYALLFFLFFLLTSASWIALLFLDEHASREVRAKVRLAEYIRGLPYLFRRDRNFARFVIASSIFSLAAMEGGLVAAFGIDRFDLHEKDYILANISMIGSGVGIATVLLFGRIGDRFGHKINMLLASAFVITGMAMVLGAEGLVLYTAGFVLINLSLTIGGVSKGALTLEFGTDAQRPTYISLKNTITAGFGFLAPLLGAYLAFQYGTGRLFTVVIAMHILHLVAMGFFVTEPRRKEVAVDHAAAEVGG